MPAILRYTRVIDCRSPWRIHKKTMTIHRSWLLQETNSFRRTGLLIGLGGVRAVVEEAMLVNFLFNIKCAA